MPHHGPDGVVLQISRSQGGVPKVAIPEAELTLAGIVGDAWRHPQIHGGPRKAILLVTAEGIDDLAARGFPVFYGALGENITTRGLDRGSLRIGQRYGVGEIVIELLQIRLPCDTLSIYGTGIQAAIYDAQTQAGDHTSPRWGLSGFYASVIRTGKMRVGDVISLLGQTD
ncbi:MAG TPA: MOSC domain-containing protein [Candidatus Acidoferrales bacterium]|jgi:MOSC domain-containing protein YiiM|nr:MOSC domain-containing protein [Candidatus Acidoferrales bacterium]